MWTNSKNSKSRGGSGMTPSAPGARRACFVAALAAFLALGADLAASEQIFTLVNATGLSITRVELTPAGLERWADHVLDVERLPTGGRSEVLFISAEDHCLWDLRLKNSRGQTLYWREVDLCAFETITLHVRDGKTWATGE